MVGWCGGGVVGRDNAGGVCSSAPRHAITSSISAAPTMHKHTHNTNIPTKPTHQTRTEEIEEFDMAGDPFGYTLRPPKEFLTREQAHSMLVR